MNKILGNRKYRKLMVLIIVLVVGTLVYTQSASAADWWNPLSWGSLGSGFGLELGKNIASGDSVRVAGMKAIAEGSNATDLFTILASYFLYYIVLTPLSWLLGVAGTFADWMLQPTYIINSTVVLVGWGVTRDLANMLFILILLGVALDYILFQSFGVKRALPMLIAVALLINFSLPIAGIFIDFANVFSDFFMGKITAGCLPGDGKSCGFTITIANNLNIAGLFDVSDLSKYIADMIFAAFLMLGTAFVLFALGIMFLLRTGWLYALLILLPLVLVLMPFPKTSQYFGRWSNQFFKWTMFAPVAMFFLYLSMLIFQANVGPEAANKVGPGAISYFMNSAQAEVWTQSYTGGFIEQVIKYIIVWFFMLGSLMAAQTMSITGAGAAYGMIKGAQKWAGGKVKNAGKKVGGAAARKANVDKGLDRAAEWASKNKVLGTLGVGRGLRGIASKTEQAIQRQGELTPSEKANYEKYSDAQLLAEYQSLATSPIPGNKAKAANIATMLTQREGNALTVKDKHGNVDEPATLALRKSAHDLAGKHNNKSAMKAIAAKDTRIKLHAVDKKYSALPAGVTTIDNMTRAEAEQDVYRDTRPKDIEEMTDTFFITPDGMKMVNDMMNIKAITSSHLRAALDTQKVHFFNEVKKFIGNLPGAGAGKVGIGEKGPPPTGLWLQNPGLAGYLESDPAQEILGLVV